MFEYRFRRKSALKKADASGVVGYHFMLHVQWRSGPKMPWYPLCDEEMKHALASNPITTGAAATLRSLNFRDKVCPACYNAMRSLALAETKLRAVMAVEENHLTRLNLLKKKMEEVIEKY